MTTYASAEGDTHASAPDACVSRYHPSDHARRKASPAPVLC